MPLQLSQDWWRTDIYDRVTAIPHDFLYNAGPCGVACVEVYDQGKTQTGWGLTYPNGKEGFIPRYERLEFSFKKAMHRYAKQNQPFAFVMRSLRMICIDIDGKNGGFDGIKQFGLLPRTLAETSKSGTGYHLFYFVPTDSWIEGRGFAEFADRIGIAPGVDIRAVGCVYHFSSQRWNDAPAAPLPQAVRDILEHKQSTKANATEALRKVMESEDPTERLLYHNQLLDELRRPIKQGRRNNTLFALGAQMAATDLHGWQVLLRERGLAVGLDQLEVDHLIVNAERAASIA